MTIVKYTRRAKPSFLFAQERKGFLSRAAPGLGRRGPKRRSSFLRVSYGLNKIAVARNEPFFYRAPAVGNVDRLLQLRRGPSCAQLSLMPAYTMFNMMADYACLLALARSFRVTFFNVHFLTNGLVLFQYLCVYRLVRYKSSLLLYVSVNGFDSNFWLHSISNCITYSFNYKTLWIVSIASTRNKDRQRSK